MNIQFATCNKSTALGYLQKVYPSKVVTKEMVAKLLCLVERDILRVQDPLMHGNRIAVIGGNNYKKSDDTEISQAINQLKENNLM